MKKLLLIVISISIILPNIIFADNLGNCDTVGNWNSPGGVTLQGTKRFLLDTIIENGYVDTIKILARVSNAFSNINWKTALYRLKAGVDTILVGQSDEQTLAITSLDTLWLSAVFSTPVQLYADSQYFLSVWGETGSSTFEIMRSFSSGKLYRYATATYGDWPSTILATSGSSNYYLWICAHYNDGLIPSGVSNIAELHSQEEHSGARH